MTEPANIFVKLPRTAPLGYFAGKHETGLIEIGELIERHQIGFERAIWVSMIDLYDFQFSSENDLAAFKLVCPFETMSYADGQTLIEEKAAEELSLIEESRKIFEAKNTVRLAEFYARVDRFEALFKLADADPILSSKIDEAALRNDIEALRKGSEASR
jgi:hypothetical protein